MLDRVREAMFSTLGPWLADDARVLDLFAGSGSLGLEALSRGAARARFVERDERTAQLLRANVTELALEDRATVACDDALAPRAWGGVRGTEGAPPAPASAWADIVFFDPPYPLLSDFDAAANVLTAAHRLVRDVLAPEGVLVFHAPRRRLDEHAFDPDLAVRERVYGSNSLWYAQREDDA